MSTLDRTTRSIIPVLRFGPVDDAAIREKIATCESLADHDALPRVVVVDDYLNPQLEEFNREAVAEKFSWFPIRAIGDAPWIGPIFEPDGPCWSCLSHRLQMNGFTYATAENRPDNESASERDTRKLSEDMAANLATRELISLLTPNGAQRYRLIALHPAIVRAEYHPVVKNPRCRVCGTVSIDDSTVALKSCPKPDGGDSYRTCTAEDTWQRLAKQISPITGIIAGLSAPSSQSQSGAVLHTYICKFRGQPWSPGRLRESRLEMSFGKGMTDVQAKVSCVAEAIERYCGSYHSDNRRKLSTFAELPGAIHPHDLLLFSERQYNNRDALNSPDDLFNWVPNPFDPERPIEWTKAWSLRDQCMRYLPTAFCYYYYPDDNNSRFCIANSNGCASGNTLEEATLQGLLEVIERDCVGMWWYNRLKLPEVLLETFEDPYFSRMTSFFAANGRCLRVIDITNDLAVPAFAAVSWRADGKSILFGTGAHLDAKIGIRGAISELSQRLGFALKVEQGLPLIDAPAENRIAKWLREESVTTHAYFEPINARTNDKEHYHHRKSTDLLLDITDITDRLSRLGLETIILDMSEPGIDLATVRITVPGLRHSWARFAPGRLYDVPVEMGWLTQKTAESDLNPVYYFV